MSKKNNKGLVPKLRFPEFRNSGEWKLVPLTNALLSITNGLSIEQINNSAGYKVTRIETISNHFINLDKVGFIITNQNLSQYKLNIGDILFSNINSLEHIGKCAFVDKDYDLYHGMNLLRLVTNEKDNIAKYIYYLLKTSIVNRSIKSRSNKAVNQASINQTELGRTSILLPTKQEQQKIADCLTSLDNLITAETQKLDALKSHKKGLMQNLFPADGETVPKLRFPEFRDSGEWEINKLGDVTKSVSKKNSEGLKLPIYSINNVVGFMPQNEQFEGIDSNDRGYDISLYKIIDKHTFAYNPARINVGSIGYSGELHDIIISSLYVCFKTKNEINDKFLQIFLKTSIFMKSVNNKVEGGIRSYLFYENFSNIQILIPPTIKEQQKIVDCLTSLDDMISSQSHRIETLKAHKKGLMQQLFPSVDEVDE